MKTTTADLLFEAHNALGEGPLWHPIEKRLYWVDILAGDLYQTTGDQSGFMKTHFNTQIGAFAFKADGDFLLATADGFAHWRDGQDNLEFFWNPLPDREGVRLNDGKVDPAGRFWAGSMDTAQIQGELYRIDPDGSQHTVLNNIGISNGLGWSPDCKTMYYTDSLQYTIFAFDYDLDTGEITNQRPFVPLPRTADEIVPDGLCVDVEGCVWSANWNGWQVIRYDPRGKPIQKVKVPVQRVTSCFFGGDQLDQLFITTARVDIPSSELVNQPHAGDIFIYQTDTQGQGTHLFGKN